MRARRLVVDVYEPETAGWRRVGMVTLPWGADRLDVEHALVAVGVYAPRGADTMLWFPATTGRIVSAAIWDGTGLPMVRLFVP